MNKKSLISVSILWIVRLLSILLLTGCNKQVFDFNKTFEKATCKIGDEVKTIELKSWKDYDGEQLQLVDKQGTVYLVSSINCTLIHEK